ncbi:MAG: GNAT family N-acetyltransferase [Burkholderiales bacterium]|nr:GNAT family N-acetyltransferase [Burkholderiales bacterium]
MTFCAPVTLEGQHVRLEPLAAEHHDELVDAVKDGELWQLWYTTIPSPEQMRAEIARRLDLRARGSMLPFVIRRLDTGALCGMTTYMNVEEKYRRVEIGSTWMAASAQRTAINSEAKLLLLSYAFEALRCIVVEFHTNFMNMQSRAAIARLGAKQDGILRNNGITPGGQYRDTVVFSIIESEWATVKQHLQYKLARHGNSPANAT